MPPSAQSGPVKGHPTRDARLTDGKVPKVPAAQPNPDLQRAGERAVLTTRRWTQLSTRFPAARPARLLADVLADPDGLDFTVEFVDGVVRPEDLRVAAQNLSALVKRKPGFLPAWLRTPARVGGFGAKLAPDAVVIAARKVFQALVRDLVLDARPEKLGDAIRKLKADGSRLNLNLLGEAVLGDGEAEHRLHETFELLKRDDVDYVSLKVSAVVGPHSDWSHDQIVDQAVERLLPLYQYAASSPTPKFINLDMEEYKDLDLTLDVFEKLLDRDELLGLEAGIVIQAYLPDSLPAMQRVQDWAAARRARGGAPIKVRLVKGANLAMETVESELHGWPLATWESKKATDANYIRILDWALTPERTENVKVGVAGHNLFTLALAWELAQIRGVTDAIDIEMLVGMADGQAQAIRDEIGDVLLYVPVVHPKEFDVAIAYLVRRLEENASEQNYMSSVFDIGTDQKVFDKEKERFELAMRMMTGEGTKRCHPARTQNRQTENARQIEHALRAPGGGWRFANTPDTDPALIANREWADQIVARIDGSELGVKTVEKNTVKTQAALDKTIKAALRAGEKWAKKPASERAEVLHKVGVELALHRAELIEVAAAELGKTIGEADVEVSEAIDFAHYYADRALALEQIAGATFDPVKLTVVVPPWNFPLAIPFGGMAAALSAGSAAILKPATIAKRCGAMLTEIMWKAGVPKALAPLVVPGDREIGKALIAGDSVDRVVLTGSSQTAEQFLQWRPEMGLIGETSGKNAIIVTPSADLDLAVKDIVRSAYGHAGQKCSAASLVILVGSVGLSRRVHNQLIDAISSLRVDWPTDPASEMGPLSETPGDKLRRGLTKLEPGQSWAIKPYSKDKTDRLWTPGLRAGVAPGSQFHMVEYFGPVLGVMRAGSLEEAIEIQNATDYGLTAGLHSLSTDEIKFWLDRVQAGNVYVNRGITGAIVRRQPFGGWKLSSVGATAKAGGPNYLYSFGALQPSPIPEAAPLPHEGTAADKGLHVTKPQLVELLEVAGKLLSGGELARVEQAAYNAEKAAATELDRMNDPSALAAERNVLRYVPSDAILRAEGDWSLADLLVLMAAAVATGEFAPNPASGPSLVRVAPGQFDPYATVPAMVVVSVDRDLPLELLGWTTRYGFDVAKQSGDEFTEMLTVSEAADEVRVRALGISRGEIQRNLGGTINVAIWDGPATTAARVEAIPFVREQAVSITTHRFGNPTSVTKGILDEGAY